MVLLAADIRTSGLFTSPSLRKIRENVDGYRNSNHPHTIEATKPTFPIWLNIPLSKSSAFFKPLSICETLAVGMAIITP